MNLKTTIALLILAAGVGVLVWKGSSLAPRAGLAPAPLPEAQGKSAEALADIKRDDITSVGVAVPGTTPVYFGAAGPASCRAVPAERGRGAGRRPRRTQVP